MSIKSRANNSEKQPKCTKATAQRRKEGIVKRIQQDFEATLTRCVSGSIRAIKSWGQTLAEQCNHLSQERDDQPALLQHVGGIVSDISQQVTQCQSNRPISVGSVGHVEFKNVLSDLLRIQGLLSAITASYCTRTQKGTIPAVNKTGFGGKNGQPATKLMTMFGVDSVVFQQRYPEIWGKYGQLLKGKSMPVDWTPLFLNIALDLTSALSRNESVPPLRSPSRPELDINDMPLAKRPRNGNAPSSHFMQQQTPQQTSYQTLQQQLQDQMLRQQMDVDAIPNLRMHNFNNFNVALNGTPNVQLITHNALISNPPPRITNGIGSFVSPQQSYPLISSQSSSYGVNAYSNAYTYDSVDNSSTSVANPNFNCANLNINHNNINNVNYTNSLARNLSNSNFNISATLSPITETAKLAD